VSPAAEDEVPSPLLPGLYEQMVDRLLERRISASSRSAIDLDDEQLDAGESHTVLADHLRGVIREVLGGVIGADRLTRQVELVNRILRELEAADSNGDRRLSSPPHRLLSVWPWERLGDGKPEVPDTHESRQAIHS
jgi:hypothetical protein